jgi:hypothetical protein
MLRPHLADAEEGGLITLQAGSSSTSLYALVLLLHGRAEIDKAIFESTRCCLDEAQAGLTTLAPSHSLAISSIPMPREK